MSFLCQPRPALLQSKFACRVATVQDRRAAIARKLRGSHICSAQEQTRERRFQTPSTSSDSEGAPPPPPPPPPKTEKKFPVRRAVLAGLGVTAVALGFLAAVDTDDFEDENIQIVEAPTGEILVPAADIYADNQRQLDRPWLSMQPKPLTKYTIFEDRAFARLKDDSWLLITGAVVSADVTKGALVMESRGGRQYTLEMPSEYFKMNEMNMSDEKFMNAFFNKVGAIDDQLYAFQIKALPK